MLIDRIYQKVKSIINTEVRGNVEAQDFNNFIHNAIQERYEFLFSEFNRHLNSQERGLQSNGLENLPDKISEKILHYHKIDTLPYDSDSTRNAPSDLKYLDSIELADGTDLEVCRRKKEFQHLKGVATSQYPIVFRSGSLFWIYPGTSETMTISYLRKPDVPKWTFIDDGSGNAMFNPSAGDFSDADIHPSEEFEMIRLVLKQCGVNLKEQDLTQYAMGEEEKEFRNDNTD
jgi:hypothetical protein